jgi:hypothetical protein
MINGLWETGDGPIKTFPFRRIATRIGFVIAVLAGAISAWLYQSFLRCPPPNRRHFDPPPKKSEGSR